MFAFPQLLAVQRNSQLSINVICEVWKSVLDWRIVKKMCKAEMPYKTQPGIQFLLMPETDLVA